MVLPGADVIMHELIIWLIEIISLVMLEMALVLLLEKINRSNNSLTSGFWLCTLCSIIMLQS
jgi:hypothetical protein